VAEANVEVSSLRKHPCLQGVRWEYASIGLPLATACVTIADLVIRGLLGAGLVCIWPSEPPLVGGFGIL